MKENAPFAILISTMLAIAACEQDRVSPTAVEPAVESEAAPVEAFGPVVEEGACPCWTARSLGATFPVASFWFHDLAAEKKAGQGALQLSNIANARVLQALVEFDPHAATEGDNWCQVATFGQAGLERESTSALKIMADEFTACVTLLEQRAEAAGLAAN